MNLVKPTRPVRDPGEFTRQFQWFDHETVEQPDGRLAQFSYDSKKPEEGWQFACWKDRYGFTLLEGDDQTGEFAQLLLDSTPEKRAERQRAEALRRAKADPKLVREVGDFSKFVLPVIANCTAAPISDLLAVQPLSTPKSTPKSTPLMALEFSDGLRGRPKPPPVGPDELLHSYEYGGVLSERGGWFVTHRDHPDRVLRYRLNYLS